MLHTRRHLLLALLLVGFSPALTALPTDKDAPVEIEADSADIDGKTNTTTYRGKVRISQGSMELRADKVVIEFKERKPSILTATGNPARFRQKPEKDKGWVTGQGRTIVYHINSEELVLTGDAVLTQNDDSFHSDRIVYDRVKARLKAGAAAQGSERVRVIIHPRDTP